MPKRPDTDPGLELRPGLELDVLVFRRVFDGIVDPEYAPAGHVPSFSRNTHASKAVFIKTIIESDTRTAVIEFGQEHFPSAAAAGHVPPEKAFPVWKVTIDGMTGYGRTQEEAVCKLALLFRARGACRESAQ